MPEPKPGEKQSAYISRCVREVMKEGSTQEQALGKCFGLWRQHKKKQKQAKNSKMEYIAVNFQGDQIRTDVIDGQPHFVIPVVMMTEGVHNGSLGPLLYKSQELEKWSPAWNHKPIVINHPKGGSACTKEFLNKYKVGVILNTRWDTKQRAEAWINIEKVKKLFPKVYQSILNKQVQEVSTGLYVDLDGSPGEFNGAHYDAIAINHRPDHLAILVDSKGACSVEKGAGLFQLNSRSDSQCSENNVSQLVQFGVAMEGGYFPIETKEDLQAAICCVNKLGIRGINVIQHIIDRANHLGLSDEIPKSWNELSHSETARLIHTALSKDSFALDAESIHIEDIFDHYFIFSKDGQLFKQKYTSSNNNIDLVDQPTPVKRVVSYKLLNFSHNMENEEMDKKDVVDRLITHKATQWKDEDREWLMSLNEDTLKKMEPLNYQSQEDIDAAIQKGIEQGVANELQKIKEREFKPKSVQEYIAAMPVELQTVFNNAMKSLQTEVDRLVSVIVSNKNNKFSKEQLVKMDLEMLRNLASLAASADNDSQQYITANYLGMAPVATNTSLEEEGLPLPKYDDSKFVTRK